MDDTHGYPDRTVEHKHTPPVGHHRHLEPEELEPSFSAEPVTSDAIEAAEEGEPYFAPTDPIVRPVPGKLGSLEVVGGFAATSMDDSGPDREEGSERRSHAEQIRLAVERELREDAMTTDLQIDVSVRGRIVRLSGAVPSMEDAEAAEAVANRVEGVHDVVDDLVIQSQP